MARHPNFTKHLRTHLCPCGAARDKANRVYCSQCIRRFTLYQRVRRAKQELAQNGLDKT